MTFVSQSDLQEENVWLVISYAGHMMQEKGFYVEVICCSDIGSKMFGLERHVGHMTQERVSHFWAQPAHSVTG